VNISSLKQSQDHEGREASYSENKSKWYRDPLSSGSSRAGGINTLAVPSNKDEDEITLFKRIVQETSKAAPPETRFHQSIGAPSSASPRPSGSSSQYLQHDPTHRSMRRASNWSSTSSNCHFSIATSTESTSNLIVSDEACDGSNPSDPFDDSTSSQGSDIHLASSLNDRIIECFTSHVDSTLILEHEALNVNSQLLSTLASSSDEPTEPDETDSLIELELQGNDAVLRTPATSEASAEADSIFCLDVDDYNEDLRQSRDMLLGLTLAFPSK
jgi:hypothetical protein